VWRTAGAQAYPSRPVDIVVGFPASSAGDTAARLIGERLLQRFGQPFVIDNRPGASTVAISEPILLSAATQSYVAQPQARAGDMSRSGLIGGRRTVTDGQPAPFEFPKTKSR
jgi:tripartite-type tricarboxylate transporter receptor subunit TctC